MVIDLHVHTSHGSGDSVLDPVDMVESGEQIGLDGVCITEHGMVWYKHDFESFRRQHNPALTIIKGMEVGTDLGHILVFGLDAYVSGIHWVEKLRRVVDEVGGFMIFAHPFRLFDDLGLRVSKPSFEDVMNDSRLRFVDEIEVANGENSEHENFLALQMTKKLGFKGTAGSDAHSTHGLGCFTTVFEREIETEADLIRELKAGRFYPAQGLRQGKLTAIE